MEENYCQSCGMPMNEEFYGTEANNEKNQEYCIYCYENGAFKQPELTMEQMIDVCVPFMKNKGMKEQEARALMSSCLPQLKRWKKEDMPVRILEKSEMLIVGKEIRTTNEDGKCMKEILELWQQFKSQKLGDKIPNKVEANSILGIYTDYENNEKGSYSFIVGFQVSSIEFIPEGMVSKVIPASKYYVVTAKGKMPQKIGEAWAHIWNSGISRTYKGDFELYDERYNDTENAEVDIYVSIK
ncbi:effector binding domain-containing protein [Clostridium magnum]|nr:effector binding domain-containing protein [Clostridium magnum]KZL89931.1 putative zinc ribbon domain protein [Clostridium magnum DSM 2767]SHI44689.1 Predicted transcriptional regulator YdeE, contains AraC-type DNA-binding domain [Clostridium magnum DSM 2767]